MIFLLLVFLYEVAMHHLDWRRWIRGTISRPVEVIGNYVIGTVGLLMAYELWLAVTDSSGDGWLLMLNVSPYWKFPLVLLSGGVAVALSYLSDSFISHRDGSAEKDEQIMLKDAQIKQLESELKDAKTERA